MAQVELAPNEFAVSPPDAIPATGTALTPDEEYVFAGNARRWKYVRAGLITGGGLITGLAGLLVVLCVESPDLPDLNLHPTTAPAHVQTAALRAEHKVDRRLAAQEGSMLKQLSRVIVPAHKRRHVGLRYADSRSGKRL